jgi:hypothetical protein
MRAICSLLAGGVSACWFVWPLPLTRMLHDAPKLATLDLVFVVSYLCNTVMLLCDMLLLMLLQPMRTESGADDSWEDKAEKEDALAAAAAAGGAAAPGAAAAGAKASRTSSPFASGGTEDDGRQRYTLDFMKKHRCVMLLDVI